MKLRATLARLKNQCPLLIILAGLSIPSFAQTSPNAPKNLPGKGLKQFDFFYAGESKARNMYIIKDGKITWSYIDTVGKGEISDAVLLKNGNILFAHQFGVTLINKDKKVLWKYDAPDGFETHTAQPIGNEHVVFVQNGNPAKVFVMNIKTNKVIKEFAIPFKSGTHGQIRHARLTKEGTLLIAHMDLGKVNEYDLDGKILLSIDVPSVWSAHQLPSGNLLVASNQRFVKELNRNGEVVWGYLLDNVKDYKLTNPQIAMRLPNGNTLINNWFNQWDGKVQTDNEPVQAVEVTPNREIVWALREWKLPVNLGPSTTFQLLNDPNGITEKVHFGNIK
ncbi:beta-propeller domain-containing protein [Pedobacter sp. PWIIR3]